MNYRDNINMDGSWQVWEEHKDMIQFIEGLKPGATK